MASTRTRLTVSYLVVVTATLVAFAIALYVARGAEADQDVLEQAASLADDVRYLGSVLIREDEVVLCHFEGSADAIRRVAKRARVPYERLLATTVSVPTEDAPLQERSSA